MTKLKLVWENNLDTPLSAENLSKFVSYSTDDNKRILYVDEPAVYPNGDGQLKIRANSKISFPIPVTNAFFRFDDSLVSHNSKYIPTTTRALTYRIESDFIDSKSLAIDESSTNTIDDSLWQTIENGSTSISIYQGDIPSEDAYYATINVDSSGSRGEIFQTVSFTNGSTVSLSFYYKGSGLKLIVEGDPNGTIRYWRDEVTLRQWELSQYTYNLPDSADWTRFQLDNIDTSALSDGEIKIRLFSTEADEILSVGAVQFEELNYCSSYIPAGDSRNSSQLILPSTIIDPFEGCVDIVLRVDSFENNNVIFRVPTTSNDAYRLYFDTASQQLVLTVYDKDTSTFNDVRLNVNLSNLKEEFIRIIACWKHDLGIKISAKISESVQTNTLNLNYSPFSTAEISEIQVGGQYTGAISASLLRGMIDYLKFDFIYKSPQQITDDMSIEPYPSDNDYKFFEAGSENIILNETFLDTGSSFDPSTKYFVWVCDDRNDDTATIVLSKSGFEPLGYKRYFSRILGSFSTNLSSQPDEFSVWDVSTYSTDVIHTNKFVLGGIESPDPDVEISRNPFSLTTSAVFNIPTHYEDHIYSGSFMDIDPLGIFNFDNVRIDGSTVSSIGLNSDLNITANGSGSVVIDSENVEFNSGAGSLQLDNVRIKDNKIYSQNGYNLLIRNDESTSNIVMTASNGTIQLSAQNIDLDAGSGSIYFDQITIEQNTISNTNDDLILTSIDDVMIQSGSGEIHLDSLKIKDDTLFNDVGDLNIEATGHSVNITGQSINFNASSGGLGLEDLRIDSNKLYSTTSFDLILETGDSTRDVRINSPGTGSVYINNVKFDSNQIYSDSGVDLQLHSVAGTDVVFTGNNVLLETQLTADDENIRFIDSNTATTNIQSNQSGYGVNIYPESSRGSGDAVFTVSDNSQAKQFEVLSGSGVRVGQSGTLQYNQSTPTGSEVLGYNGYFYANKVYNAVYNDLAECWEKEIGKYISYGQVVVRVSALNVEPSKKRADTAVVGVVSKDFGYLLGSEGFDEDLIVSKKVPVAISGRVKVRLSHSCTRNLKYGDEFVSAPLGTATKANWFERVFKRSAIIGKLDVIVSDDEIIIKV